MKLSKSLIVLAAITFGVLAVASSKLMAGPSHGTGGSPPPVPAPVGTSSTQ